MELYEILVFAGTALAALVIAALVVVKGLQNVKPGQVLVISGMNDQVRVSFTQTFVSPFIKTAEVMDISLKRLDIDRRGKDGLICRDCIRADVTATFLLHVNKTADDILMVAQSIGCERASDLTTLRELFEAKFGEALKIAASKLDFEDVHKHREDFRDYVIETVGCDLIGFVLEDLSIDYLEQTPIDDLDEHNIIDAKGIEKIKGMLAK